MVVAGKACTNMSHVVSYLGKAHREYDIPGGFKPSTDAYLRIIKE